MLIAENIFFSPSLPSIFLIFLVLCFDVVFLSFIRMVHSSVAEFISSVDRAISVSSRPALRAVAQQKREQGALRQPGMRCMRLCRR